MDAIVQECQEFLRLSIEADGNNRARALNDLQFRAGEQWPADVKAARDLQKRPCLTINKTDTLIRQVTNNMRMQRPRMIVHPVGDGADQATADVIKGLLRHIEANSAADVAYDTAADFQVTMGWGYWRVDTRYVSDTSFDQELYIDRIANPFTVYYDPFSIQVDGSDAERVVITDTMRKRQFRREYPKAQADGQFPALGMGDNGFVWGDKETIRLAEFWKVDRSPDKLLVLSNGWTGFKSQVDLKAVEKLGVTVIQERDSYRRRVMCYKLTAFEVLEKYEWKGKWIPIVPIYGYQLDINGQARRFGMVANMRDPAMMYNFWRTSEAELVALAPKAPWLLAEGQDEGYESEWENANNVPYSRLRYKPRTFDDGTPVPPPMRQNPQQIPQANVQAALGADTDLKSVAGIFDPSLGARENDPSGVALDRHQQQSDASNFHFYDNLCRSLRFTGKMLLDLIPHYYDVERVVRIIGDDGEPKSVTLNQKQQDDLRGVVKVLNDVRTGVYDIILDTGPGYATKRRESAEGMLKLLTTPLGEMVSSVAGDLVVRELDFSGARDLADRLKAVIPAAQQDDLPGLPQEAQGIVKGLQAQLQQAQQAIQMLQMEKKAKIWGDEQWIAFERWKTATQEQGDTQRLLIKEGGETKRRAMQDATKVHDTNVRAAEDRFEAILDARTDLALGKDRGAQNDTD